MCKKAKSWLAFELRCKDRKEAKFCRLPLLSVRDVSHSSPQSPQIQSFHENKVQIHFTLGRPLQDSPQPHSSSVFLFQDINDLLENMTGWAKREVLSWPHVCESQISLLGFWCPRPSFSCRKLPSVAPGAANFQPEELKTLHRSGQFDPKIPHSLELSLLNRWICLPGCISVTGSKNTNAECNLVTAAAKGKENKELLICQILNLPFACFSSLQSWILTSSDSSYSAQQKSRSSGTTSP